LEDYETFLIYAINIFGVNV